MQNCLQCGKHIKRKSCHFCSRECYKTHGDPTHYKTGHKGLVGEENPEWKGDKSSYSSLHAWAKRWVTNASSCKKCGLQDKILVTKNNIQKRYLQLANISGNYLRNKDDWMYLCPQCHYYFDFGRASIDVVFLSKGRPMGK